MAAKVLTAFRMDPDIMDGMRRVKERDGVPMSVQVHRALQAYLAEKGLRTKVERKRVSRRKHS